MIRSTSPTLVRQATTALTALLLVALLAAAPHALAATAPDSTAQSGAHDAPWGVALLDWLQRSVGHLAGSDAEVDDGALLDPDPTNGSPAGPVSGDTPQEPESSGEDGPFLDPHG